MTCIYFSMVYADDLFHMKGLSNFWRDEKLSQLILF